MRRDWIKGTEGTERTEETKGLLSVLSVLCNDGQRPTAISPIEDPLPLVQIPLDLFSGGHLTKVGLV